MAGSQAGEGVGESGALLPGHFRGLGGTREGAELVGTARNPGGEHAIRVVPPAQRLGWGVAAFPLPPGLDPPLRKPGCTPAARPLMGRSPWLAHLAGTLPPACALAAARSSDSTAPPTR